MELKSQFCYDISDDDGISFAPALGNLSNNGKDATTSL